MGLSGPKNRRKLAHDPNNTKWTRNETNFGHRILRSQGWEPGKFLGAQNSAHSDLHTAASSAPIKVVLKDDTMGLGAKQRQKQSTECTGLDGFKDLLGRLNGKSEDTLEKERQVRSDIKTSLYVDRRFGAMRFVSGGLLVGDQIRELISTDSATLKKEEEPTDSANEEGRHSKKAKKEKKSKKRKAEETESVDVSDTTREKKRKKRSKDEIAQNESTEDSDSKYITRKRKKSKRSKEALETEDGSISKKIKKEENSKRSKKSKDNPGSIAEPDSTSDNVTSKEKEGKKKRKREKKEKKREKSASSGEASSTGNLTPSVPTPVESGSATTTGTGTSTPVIGGRHHVRARFIASKRSAFADIQALNQIFMVKPV